MVMDKFISHENLATLIVVLQQAGYRCVGPQVRDGAIIYDTVSTLEQFPRGYQDRQAPGQYHLEYNDSGRLFSWANGPQALKPLLFTPREALWHSERRADGSLAFNAADTSDEAIAVIGVRACDLAALALQDAHFLGQDFPDPYYATRRERLFLVAVNCTHPADTCFCASTGDGPTVNGGCELILAELADGFLIAAANERGRKILTQLETVTATARQVASAETAVSAGIQAQSRQLPNANLQERLFANLDHSRWHDVAERCLACGNCTAVCPTCFCYSEHDEAALKGEISHHYREWDSCFSQGHSAIHGIVIRADTRSRYRQWLTHKLGGWQQQYGRSGCVGCGRCISWCPVGIDITEEAAAVCAGEDN